MSRERRRSAAPVASIHNRPLRVGPIRIIGDVRRSSWWRFPRGGGPSFASASLGAAKTTCCGGAGDLIFKNADLRNAKFEDASLLVDGYYADIDFRDADLRGATFEDASLYASSYGNIDFDGAREPQGLVLHLR